MSVSSANLHAYKHILCIVESPNKVKSVSKILRDLGYNNIFVKASVGHISEIKNSGIFNMGIDPQTFDMDLVVSDDKKKIVKELKEQVRLSDFVILASDPDREGEAIAWSLKHFLKIPENKYERIVYHEITKSAISYALDHPRKIDDNLVSAAHTRSRLDKIVGFRLSPVARQNVSARSVGRCQSAGLKLVVDREKEIQNFKPETYYEMFVNFEKNNTPFRAKYQGDGERFDTKLKSIAECDTIASECKGKDYIVSDIEQRMTEAQAPLPFITSSFQQECSSKLGMSVKSAMSYAQKLFEGIDIGGIHRALTTYLRTDSTTMSDEFVFVAKDYITENYGKEYYGGVRKAKKKENAQEGHECFRIIDPNMTPEKLERFVEDKNLIRVYSLIYRRTLASLMSPRKIFETTYTILNGKHRFTLASREEKFDGWRKVYNVEKNEEEEVVKESFKKGEKLLKTTLERIEKSTQPPSRYTEASLVKTLDKLGIGRPSTYATIISTLLDEKRNYCKVIDKKLQPTDLAVKLIDFLDKNFSDIVDPSYTAGMEKSLDEISGGELKDTKFLRGFYDELDGEIERVAEENSKICPDCGGIMSVRKGRYGMFLGCSNYPTCKHTEKI